MPIDDHIMATEMVKTGLDVIILGGPGTGKTWFLKNILPYIDLACGRRKIYYTATTGVVAAMLPDGITIDMLFKRNNYSLPFDCVVVIDECSMLSSDMWKSLLCARVHRNVQFILVGDLDQLPPVNNTAFYRLCEWRDTWHRTTLAIRFTTQRRINQEDIDYHAFMHDFRHSTCVTRHMRNMLAESHARGRMLSASLFTDKKTKLAYRKQGRPIPDLPQHTMESILFVCGTLKDVVTMNTHMLALKEPRPNMITKIAQPYDHHALTLCIGCPVMVTENIYRPDEAGESRLYVANGMTGIVCGIAANKKSITIRSSTDASTKYTIERVVPFGKTKKSMPLVLFFATTVHKLQGCTLPENIILFADMAQIRGFWDKKQFTVAFSRGSKWKQVYIRNLDMQQLERFMQQPRAEHESSFIEEFSFGEHDSYHYIFDLHYMKQLTAPV